MNALKEFIIETLKESENKKEINKRIVERYPYLLPRNVWTDKVDPDYDYSYIRSCEIPDGWNLLFLQLCEDIREPLMKIDYLEKFRFSQIKEKYGRLECYTFGEPDEVHDIITKYRAMSQYVCNQCGKPAEYMTIGYILPFCPDCFEKYCRKYDEPAEKIEFKDSFVMSRYSKGVTTERTISFKEEWERYLDIITDEYTMKYREIDRKFDDDV